MTTTERPPSAEQEFQRLKSGIHRQIVEAIDLSRLAQWKPERVRREVRGLAAKLVEQTPQPLEAAARERLVDELMDESFGLGPLEPLMRDPRISDILVNGPRMVYVERAGRLEKTDIAFADDAHLTQIIQRIAARVGRRVDELSPMVDARLPDGSRVNAIVPPLSLEGPMLSIRRFGVRLTAEDILANGTIPPGPLAFLQAAVESRINLLVSGGAGSGKTTMLNILSQFIPPEERLVTIEDSAELLLQQPHVVRLEARPANLEGQGEVKLRDLVRNSLRMRPDRIIVGEVRGGEALEMLQAMNTGHDGSICTIHANDTRDALARLEMMVMMAGFDLPVPVVRQYIAGGVALIVQLARLKGGQRRMTRISEILRMKKGRYVVRDLFGFQQSGVEDGQAVGQFYATGRLPNCLDKLQANGIDLPTNLFTARTLGEPTEVDDYGFALT